MSCSVLLTPADTPLCGAVCCSESQCVAVSCSELQSGAVRCSELQFKTYSSGHGAGVAKEVEICHVVQQGANY